MNENKPLINLFRHICPTFNDLVFFTYDHFRHIYQKFSPEQQYEINLRIVVENFGEAEYRKLQTIRPGAYFEFQLQPFGHVPIVPQADKTWLKMTFQQISNGGQGQIVFLTGARRSGRQYLARWLMDETKTTAYHLAIHFGEKAGRLTWELFPSPELRDNKAYQALQKSDPNLPEKFHRQVREIAKSKPFILHLYQVERVLAIWWHTVLDKQLRPEIQDLPLLLFISIATIQSLKLTSSEQLAGEVLQKAAHWFTADDGLVHEIHLSGRVRAEDLPPHFGPMHPNVQKLLYHETGGDTKFLSVLWDDWQKQNYLRPYHDQYYFKQDIPVSWGDWFKQRWHKRREVESPPVFGDTRDFVEEQLKLLLATRPQLFDEAQAQQILQVAALDDEDYFWPQAVAEVLGHEGPQVEALLEGLSQPDDADLKAMVIPLEPLLYARYRFAALLLYHTWRKYMPDTPESRQWRTALADTLRRLFDVPTTAQHETIINLYEQAHATQAVTDYRQKLVTQPSWETLWWQLQLYRDILEKPRAEVHAVEYTILFQTAGDLVEQLRDAADVYGRGYEWAKGYEAAKVGRDVGQLLPNRNYEVLGWYYMAYFIIVAKQSNHYAEALHNLEQAYKLRVELKHDLERGKTCYLMGTLYYYQQQYDQALGWCQEAYNLVKNYGRDKLQLGRTCYMVGLIYYDQQQYDQALRWHDEAYHLMKSNGRDKMSLGQTCHIIGRVYYDQQQYDQALRWYQEAYHLIKSDGRDKVSLGWTCYRTGQVYYEQGNYAEAMRYGEESLELHRAASYSDTDLVAKVEALLEDCRQKLAAGA